MVQRKTPTSIKVGFRVLRVFFNGTEENPDFHKSEEVGRMGWVWRGTRTLIKVRGAGG